MDAATLNIKKYDPGTCPEHMVVVAIAKRRSGKSFLLKDWLYHHRNRYFAGIVMSGTEEGNRFYENEVGIPKSFIYNDFDEGALQRMVDRQRQMTIEGKAKPVYVILDDLAFDRKVWSKPLIRQLLMNGRHWKISVYITLQYFLEVSPAFRANIDLIVLLKDNLHREKLYKTFFQMLPNFAMFNTIMDACTADFKALILDNSSNSTKISECIYWYKAKARPPFRIGHPIFYEYKDGKTKKDKKPLASSGKKKVTLLK
ncbi:MAG: hypothetical protein ACO35C_04475 [Pontimonas sp.]